MKNNYKYLIGMFLFATMMIVAACNEMDDDRLQGPTVTATSLSPSTQIQTGEVVVKGENLNTVLHVFVGQIEAPFRMEGNDLVYTVPLEVPLGEHVVTLAMINNYRVTTMMMVDILPSPIVKHITPWAGIGEEVTITGQSLSDNPIVTFDGVVANIVSTNTEATSMVVTVPSGIPDDQHLVVEVANDFGSAESDIPFFPRTNLLANGELTLGTGNEFESWEQLNGTGISELVGDGAFLGGRSMHIEPPAANPWSTQLASFPVQLEFEAEYTILFWAKADADGAHMRMSASQYDGNGADYYYSHGNDVVGQEISMAAWAPYVFTFTVGKDLPEHKILWDMGKGSVPFAIDHMALVKGAVGDINAEEPEILLNPGFEDGLNNWEILNGAFEASADAHCGSGSLMATGSGGNPWDVQIASEAMVLEVGTMYELAFWAKAGAAEGIMRASCSQYDGNGADFFYTQDFEVATDWTYYAFVFEAQTTASGDHKVVMDFGATTQTFFIDDVSLKKYDPPVSLYANGSLEDDLTSWEVLNGAIEVTDAESYDGGKSLTAVGTGGNPWDVQIATAPVALEVGKDYKMSFWAKAGAEGGIMRASCSQYDGNGADFFYTQDFEVATDWTHYGFGFTAQSTASGDHKIVLDFGATTQTFYIDDVKVYEADFSCE